jgi:hypothetical protein
MYLSSKQRTRVIVLTVAIILLLVALLSDFGRDARDWVANVWSGLFGDANQTVSVTNEGTDVADASSTAAQGGSFARPLSSVPKNADGTLAAAYRGHAAAAGQPKRAAGAPLAGGAPSSDAGGATGVASAAPAAFEGGAVSIDEGDVPRSVLALADLQNPGGAAASGGVGGGSGAFSTVPGGPFVTQAPAGPQTLPQDEPNAPPRSSVPEPGTLLLLASAFVGLGLRRYHGR